MTASPCARARSRSHRRSRGVLVAAFGLLVLRSGWIVEDAYITFRSVDNLLAGFGPRWNTAERVQAFTHPLWMLVVAAASWVTKEVFFTTIFLQLALSIVVMRLLVVELSVTLGRAVLVAMAAMLSKAFVEWSTSGLENPLGHLLAVLFVLTYLRDASSHRSLRLSLLAALGMTNRLDAALLFLPALLAEVITVARATRPAVLGERLASLAPFAMGAAPIVAWELFALVYYGSLVPNTAYAKIRTGLARDLLVAQGAHYVENSLRLDPVTLGTVLVTGVVVVCAGRRRRAVLLVVGVALDLLYTVWVGGDFMSGRFFTQPLAIALGLLADLEIDRGGAVLRRVFGPACVALLGVASFRASFPSLREPLPASPSAPLIGAYGIGDYYRGSIHSSALRGLTRDKHMPDHAWVGDGINERERRDATRLPPLWGGAGFAGYYAGPEVSIIDIFGLADPLLARLPVPDAAHTLRFRIGHFERAVPDGYRESVATGTNLVEDPDLRRYYEDVRLVTRAPLLWPARLGAVMRLNLGADDVLLERYRARYDQKRVRLKELPPTRSRNPASADGPYNWFTPGTLEGTRFSPTGLAVRLDKATHARGLGLRLTRGAYEIVYYLDRGEVGRARLDATGDVDFVKTPASAAVTAFNRFDLRPLFDDLVLLSFADTVE